MVGSPSVPGIWKRGGEAKRKWDGKREEGGIERRGGGGKKDREKDILPPGLARPPLGSSLEHRADSDGAWWVPQAH